MDTIGKILWFHPHSDAHFLSIPGRGLWFKLCSLSWRELKRMMLVDSHAETIPHCYFLFVSAVVLTWESLTTLVQIQNRNLCLRILSVFFFLILELSKRQSAHAEKIKNPGTQRKCLPVSKSMLVLAVITRVYCVIWVGMAFASAKPMLWGPGVKSTEEGKCPCLRFQWEILWGLPSFYLASS